MLSTYLFITILIAILSVVFFTIKNRQLPVSVLVLIVIGSLLWPLLCIILLCAIIGALIISKRMYKTEQHIS